MSGEQRFEEWYKEKNGKYGSKGELEADIEKSIGVKTKHDDGGKGEGKAFDWSLLKDIKRPYFLAGGLKPDNASDAVKVLKPYAVDVSTGIETDGVKDREKMTAFANTVREEG